MKKIIIVMIFILSIMNVSAGDLGVELTTDETLNGEFILTAPEINLNIGGDTTDFNIEGNINVHHLKQPGTTHTPFYEWVTRMALKIGYSNDDLDTIEMFFTLLDTQFVSHRESKQAQMLNDIDTLKAEVEYLKSLHNVDQEQLDNDICLQKSERLGTVVKYKDFECLWSE